MRKIITTLFVLGAWLSVTAQFTQSAINIVATNIASPFPNMVVTGDLNKDGYLDLAATNDGDSSVSVFLNDGSGSFGKSVNYAVKSKPTGLVIVDLNGDGNLDIAVANNAGFSISCLINNGSGSFASAVNYPAGNYPIYIAAADFNKDGHTDLAVTSTYDMAVYVLTNTGSGSFGAPVGYPQVNDPYNLKSADVNGDGFPDLAITNWGAGLVTVLTNTGTGGFATASVDTVGWAPTDLAIFDFNKDGFSDIATSNANSNTVSVLTNTGFGKFTVVRNDTIGYLPQSVAALDINKDGYPDLATANAEGTVSLLTNDKKGAFNVSTKDTIGYYTFLKNVVAGDLNNDGYPDLAIAVYGDSEKYISLLYNTPVPSLTVAGFSPQNMSYGGKQTFNATINAGYSLTYISSNPSVVSISGNNAVALATGVATITAFNIGDANYKGITVTGTITVSKAPLTVTALNASSVYGKALQTFTVSVAGLVNNQTISVSYSTAATSTSAVGTYPIKPSVSGAALANYTLTTVAGTLTITPAPLTVTAFNATMVYGGSSLPTFSGTVLGVVNSDVVTTTYGTTATVASAAGTYTIKPAVSGAALANYTLTTVAGSLTVTTAPLTVTAFNASKVYGSALPTFTGTIAGLVNSDVLTPTYSTTATSASSAGTYSIKPVVSGAALANYTLTTVAGSLTVTTAPLTVTAFNATKKYGSALPTFTCTIAGLVNSDVLTPTYSTTATSASSVGTYTIKPVLSGAVLANYALTTVAGTLTITTAPLTVTAGNVSADYGTTPAYTYSATGLVNNDNITVSYSTAETIISVGTYTIVPAVSGSALGNYTLTTVKGVLTINSSVPQLPTYSSPPVIALPSVNITPSLIPSSGNMSIILPVPTDNYNIISYTDYIFPTICGLCAYHPDILPYTFVGINTTPTINILPIQIVRLSATEDSATVSKVTGDFNKDGHVDMAVATNLLNSVTVIMATTDTTYNYSGATSYYCGDGPTGLSTNDFNNDGYLDLVTVHKRTNTISILTNTGTGAFDLVLSYTVSGILEKLVTADFNKDGLCDIVLSFPSDARIAVLLNDGAGSFTSTKYTVGSNPVQIVAGDLNADGFSDLSTPNKGDGTVSVLLNNGAGSFATTAYTVGNNPVDLALGEINQDGYIDIVVANNGSNSLTLLTNTGTGSFGKDTTYTTGTGPVSVVVKDINNDNINDITYVTYADSVASIHILLSKGRITAIEEGKKPTPFNLYPVPNSGSFYISSAEKADYAIYNINGVKVAEGSIIPGVNEINNILSKGFYLIKINNTVHKLVVE